MTIRAPLPPPPDVQRASSTDLAFRAMDRGGIPEQIGVVLMLDDAAGLELAQVRRLIAERIRAVPRLRQRLVHTPLGRGGPIWVDDPDFDVARHVRELALPSDIDEQAF